jgi:hypothetical protein
MRIVPHGEIDCFLFATPFFRVRNQSKLRDPGFHRGYRRGRNAGSARFVPVTRGELHRANGAAS